MTERKPTMLKTIIKNFTWKSAAVLAMAMLNLAFAMMNLLAENYAPCILNGIATGILLGIFLNMVDA